MNKRSSLSGSFIKCFEYGPKLVDDVLADAVPGVPLVEHELLVVNGSQSEKLYCTVRHFHPSLIFAGKAMSSPLVWF